MARLTVDLHVSRILVQPDHFPSLQVKTWHSAMAALEQIYLENVRKKKEERELVCMNEATACTGCAIDTYSTSGKQSNARFKFKRHPAYPYMGSVWHLQKQASSFAMQLLRYVAIHTSWDA